MSRFFYSLEDIGELDVNCPVDISALHFVFKPIIQHHLDSFRQGWAHHSLRTERNRTPQQLWISGLHNSRELDPDDPAIAGLNVRLMYCLLVYPLAYNIILLLVQVNWDSFGVDWEGPIPLDDDNTVTVEELEDLLSDTQKQHLKESLAPLSGSTFSQESMLAQFLLAKSYVYQSTQN